MLQILDNVWVGVNKGFNMDRNYVLCAKENPDMRYPDMGKFDTLDQCMKTMCDNDFDAFMYWLKRGGEEEGKGANLFVHHEEFALLASIFLKSILNKPTVETAHIFYKCYIERQQFMPFNKSGTYAEYLDVLKEFTPMSLDDFKPIYEKAEPSGYWRSVPGEYLPQNILFCEYILNPNGQWGYHFRQKYETRRWEEWGKIVQDLAGEVLSGATNITTIFPKIRLDIHSPLLPQLKKHREIKWIFDAYEKGWDPRYLQETFDKDLYKEVINQVFSHYASKETGLEKIIDMMALPVEQAFREDISSGFKSEYLMNSDDALFFAYIFRLKQEGRVDLIRKFELIK